MQTELTDRMKKNKEIGRIAMLQLRAGGKISEKTAQFVAATVNDPDAGRELLEADGGKEALDAIWILDDAEQMSGNFSDLENRVQKLDRLLQMRGYEVAVSAGEGQVLSLRRTGDEEEVMLLPVIATEKKVTTLTFAVKREAVSEKELTLEDLEQESRRYSDLVKYVKKLNGLTIKAEEKALKLAVFSCVEQRKIRLSKARRAAQKKARKSK